MLQTGRAAAAAVAIWALLPLMKMPRLLALIESRYRSDAAPADGDVERLVQSARRVVRFRLFVIRNNCLKRNLLYYYLLLGAGVPGLRIHIGICKEDASLAGHCWLTRGGHVFLDTEEAVAKYAVIYSSGV